MSEAERMLERIEALEAAVEGAGYAITLVIGRLSDDQRRALSEDLTPLQRRLRAERPRIGEIWSDPEMRALGRAVDLVQEALEGTGLPEA
ncbi:hypothetical protein [Brevundimonas nasdae]|uniref:Uncharacterized protein n=1 Tax=Brevundimonas nasdae TaxID=172043 RepID=A0ABX8TN00_9CAUL|nr:hypothetical protein [Brevundimonas nasdae]QYC10589.1 hypothetical protein KWG56_00755 [Brevundimonas nasdae]QYC13376.1 hypothetical protein KWG63_14310 [Brevundimonas nasdae]